MTFVHALACRIEIAWLNALLAAGQLDRAITGVEWPISRRLTVRTRRDWLRVRLRQWLRRGR